MVFHRYLFLKLPNNIAINVRELLELDSTQISLISNTLIKSKILKTSLRIRLELELELESTLNHGLQNIFKISIFIKD